MNINKKWIKRGLACIGVAAVGWIGYYLGCHGKIDMDTANSIADSGYRGGIEDGLRMIPLGKETVFTKEMLNEYTETVLKAVDLRVEDGGVSRGYEKYGPFANNFKDYWS